jgi:hypothetical protein
MSIELETVEQFEQALSAGLVRLVSPEVEQAIAAFFEAGKWVLIALAVLWGLTLLKRLLNDR